MAGETISFNITTSINNGKTVSLYKNPDIWNSSFSPLSDNGIASATYTFPTSYANLLNPEIILTFVASVSGNCSNQKLDTYLPVKITLRDTSGGNFQNINVITPNHDNINDYFEIPDAPVDNCSGQFIGISIYNRWGGLIFSDNGRNFRWDAADIPDGLYYYIIKYNNTEYKNWLMVQR